MGVINETLTLTDQFSASFRNFQALSEQSVKNTQQLDQSIQTLGKAANYISASGFDRLSEKSDAANGSLSQMIQELAEINKSVQTLGKASNNINATGFEDIARSIRKSNAELMEAIQNQRKLGDETEKTDKSAENLLGTFRKIAAATGAVKLVSAFLGLSDTQSQINAKLSAMTGSLEEAAKLQNDIYLSAQRSRASYNGTADAITKMYMNAGNAFKSNDELIAFTEALNKQFVIGGATAEEQRSAITQLTQAMAAGVLRGQDLNSVLASAPGIARNIERYMGWATGSIKKYAEEGRVTAEVVKYAMLDSAEAINEQFESMPMTLSQAMIQIRNVVQNQLQGVAAEWSNFINSADGRQLLNEMIVLFSTLAQAGVDALSFIGQGALFAADNLDFIIPVLAAIGVAYAILHAQAIATATANVAGALATAAAWAVANWPILLLAAILVAAMAAAQQFGIGMQEVGGLVGVAFGMIYATGYNTFATLWNVAASFAEFFANVFNHPVTAIVHLFTDAFDAILSMVENAAKAIDALTGSKLQGAVSGFRSQLSSWVDSNYGENAIRIKRMASLDVAATAAEWGNYGANLGNKLDNMNLNLEGIADSFSGFNLGDIPTGDELNVGNVGKVGSVKNVEGNIKLSDEDLKLYRDLAERRYMNNVELQTLAPQISVSVPESAAKNLTAQDIADKLKAILIEQAAAGTAVSHG